MEENNERPTWDEYYTFLTQATSTRSPCKKLKVGCILVKDNRIISQGYNGYLPGCKHEQVIRNGHEIATIHAEQNAITDCAKRGVSSDGCKAYITHYPCFHCMKMLCGSGVVDIRYIEDYNNDAAVADLSSITNVEVTRI